MNHHFTEAATHPKYEPQLLKKSHIVQFSQALQETHDKIPDGQKHFLKTRTEFQLAQHLHQGHALVGIFDRASGSLAAGLMMTLTESHPDSLTGAGFPRQSLTCDGAAIGAVFVRPEFQGNGAISYLLSYAEKVAQDHRICEFIAKVSDENAASARNFAKAGYRPFDDKKRVDPAEGYAVTYWHKEIEKAVLAPAAKPGLNDGHVIVPVAASIRAPA